MGLKTEDIPRIRETTFQEAQPPGFTSRQGKGRKGPCRTDEGQDLLGPRFPFHKVARYRHDSRKTR